MLLFLGAGASAPFGIPTMSGFLILFDKQFEVSVIYNDAKRIFGKECDLEVLMTVIEDLSKPKDDLFRVISPQTAFFLLSEKEELTKYLNEETRTEAKRLLDEMKCVIRNECLQAIGKDSRIVDVFDYFFSSLDRESQLFHPGASHWDGMEIGQNQMVLPSPLSIFTTNYDTCLEVYFNRKQIDFTRGIVTKYGEDILDVSSYNSSQAKSTKIFKLHGSIDLFSSKGQIRQLKAAGSQKTFLGDECGEYSIRWPIEFGGYRHVIESPYLDLFRLLRDTANEDKWWFIIGFSFRDRTICSILNDILGLKARRDRPNVFLIDNHQEPIIKRLEAWGYPSLAETICPIETEFGNRNLSANLHETLVKKGHIREVKPGAVGLSF
jgi:hypothetical protein